MRPAKLLPPPAEKRHLVLGYTQVPGQRAPEDLDSAAMGEAAVDEEEKGEANV